jgi:hypothetical protein
MATEAQPSKSAATCERCNRVAEFEVFVDTEHSVLLCKLHTYEFAREHPSDDELISSDEMGRPVDYPRYYPIPTRDQGECAEPPC